jgi:hypothetical protein
LEHHKQSWKGKQCVKCQFEGVDGYGDCQMLDKMKNETKHDVLYGIEDADTGFHVLSLFEHGFCLVDLSSLGHFSSSLMKEVAAWKVGH